MQNPFRSEAEAYRFVLLLVGYFALIVAAKVILGTWAALVMFVLLTVAGVVWLARGKPERSGPSVSARRGLENQRRVLVIANETVGGEKLRACIREKTEGFDEEVLVVVPALNSPLRHWASDEDRARAAAQERLARSLEGLAAVGIEARGAVGDGEPLQAIEDALRTFGPDEVVISTHPEGRSNWLEKGVVEAARARFSVPITHGVVDLAAEREQAISPQSPT